jgi:hypothetical protein
MYLCGSFCWICHGTNGVFCCIGVRITLVRNNCLEPRLNLCPIERRIKCDEARPICLRCSSTVRKCDGYEAISPQSRLGDNRLRLPSYRPPVFGRSENERETRSFQYFYERTVSSLAGYGGSEFWSRLVLQVSQHEKSVWHALVALGALHENFENYHDIAAFGLLQNAQDNFAIQEYVAAIRALLDPSSPLLPDTCTRASTETTTNITVDVCLISCILFVCFEVKLPTRITHIHLTHHFVSPYPAITCPLSTLFAVA